MSVRRCSKSRCSGNEAVPAFVQESDLPARQAQVAPVQQQQQQGQRISAGYQHYATKKNSCTMWLFCARTQAQSASLSTQMRQLSAAQGDADRNVHCSGAGAKHKHSRSTQGNAI